jgi:hypothetical protein
MTAPVNESPAPHPSPDLPRWHALLKPCAACVEELAEVGRSLHESIREDDAQGNGDSLGRIICELWRTQGGGLCKAGDVEPNNGNHRCRSREGNRTADARQDESERTCEPDQFDGKPRALSGSDSGEQSRRRRTNQYKLGTRSIGRLFLHEIGAWDSSGIEAHVRELDVRKNRLDVQQQSTNINVDDNGHGEGPGLIRSRRSPR